MNKKVKNAQPVTEEATNFRSKLELMHYKLLKEAGLNPIYESYTASLFEKFRLKNTLFYAPIKKEFKAYTRVIMGITYTPDFFIKYKDYNIFIDSKGQPNDVYPLKKKMFLWHLEQLSEITGEKYIFFEPHNRKQIIDTIEIIKNLT